MSAPAIASEKYVAFTTYKRDGSPKSTPVWIGDFGDGTVGFTTGSDSYKVKRLMNDPRCTLQPSDAKGKVKDGTEPVSGTGKVVAGPEWEQYRKVIKSKYGVMYAGIELIGKVKKLLKKGVGTDCAVVITLD